MKKRIIRATLLIFTLSFSLGFCYRVDDFRVNDSIGPSDIFSMQLSTDGKGKFAITWLEITEDFTNKVYLRVFRVDGSPVGPPIKVPDIIVDTYKVENARVENAILPNGNVVITRTVYVESTDVNGQPYLFDRGFIGIFDSLGNQVIPYFRGDTLPASGASRFIVYDGIAADNQGNFTVIITLANEPDLYFQQFYSAGQKRGELVRVNACGIPDLCSLYVYSPCISMKPNGRFIVSWDHLFSGLRIYHPDGAPLTDVIVPSCDDSLPKYCIDSEPNCVYGFTTRTSMDSLGNFILAFNGCDGTSNSGYQPYIRLFDSLGTPLTPNITIDELDTSLSTYSAPKTALMNDSEYVVLWGDYSNQPYGDVYVKRYKHDGAKVGIKYRINNVLGTPTSHEHMKIAVSSGHAFIAWLDKRDRPALLNSVYAQVMPVDEIGFFKAGDLNYDKALTLADVIGMVNYIFKGIEKYTPEGTPLVCDVNGDCRVSLVDVINLVNYLFKPGWPAPVGCPM